MAAGSPGVGWVRVADSVPPPGTITESTLERHGRTDDLVVWATTSGVPCVSEARCPHQWSHLAHEGAVDGEELVCLTHFWRFTTTGEGWKAGMTGRRDRKGDFRRLWIVRINAAARLNGLKYGELIDGLKKAGIEVNRKMLADLAVRSPEAFTEIAEQAKAARAA